MLINTSKINFIYILNSENKVDNNAKVSNIWYSSWTVKESLNFLSQKELRSMFLDQDIWVPLNHSWLFLLTLTDKQSVCERRLHLIFLCSKILCIIGAARFSFVLYSSVANILRFLAWVVTELFFSRSFSNVKTLPLEIVPSASWCKYLYDY